VLSERKTEGEDIMDTAVIIAFLCMMVFTAVGLVFDLRTNKLPNKLTVPVFFAGLLYHTIYGFVQPGYWDGRGGPLFALMGFGVGFGMLFVLFLVGGSGGGDVKFMGALGTWLGAWLTFQVLVISALIGGLLTAILLVPKVFTMRRLTLAKSGGGNLRKQKKEAEKPTWKLRVGSEWRIPFGLPAALGTWTVLILYWAGFVLKDWPLVHR
jgi:prepilin peptidase CpaA